MREANTILNIHYDRGSRKLPLERVYKQLFNPELYLTAYGKIYRNAGATTKGSTAETVDGMSLQKINDIIALLKQEKYLWTPVRRTEIPKANGKTRPLGLPTWSDKLLQEVLRMLLEAYYEPQFSEHSHGFRPNRGCHTALQEIQTLWKGTTWFIEGDIKGYFDNIDHSVLLDILRRDIHDGRVIRLIEDLLKAGYIEDWQFHDTLSGTPQGGIISPLLANVYLNELDRFVEDTLIPANTDGDRRKFNPEYANYTNQIAAAKRQQDFEQAERLKQERREIPSVDYFDSEYRRLRYIRYADDFLMGFVGPKKEAEAIRDRLSEFLNKKLKLTLSQEKTLITHAADEKAKFLGYEITVTKANNAIVKGKRQLNGNIALLMPQKVVKKVRDRFSKNGKVIHNAAQLQDSDYTIIQIFQAILKGLYNYYCMAVNVGHNTRMGRVKEILQTALTKTLAHKHKCRVSQIYRKYQSVDSINGLKVLRIVIERTDKKPLVAVFGGFPLVRTPKGKGVEDFRFDTAGRFQACERSEVVQRLLAGKCELCGATEKIAMHHIRKLADLNKPGRRPKAKWEMVMSARRRKTLAVCEDCHKTIHAGQYDGPKL